MPEQTAKELARELLRLIAFSAYPPIFVEVDAGAWVRLEDYLTVAARWAPDDTEEAEPWPAQT